MTVRADKVLCFNLYKCIVHDSRATHFHHRMYPEPYIPEILNTGKEILHKMWDVWFQIKFWISAVIKGDKGDDKHTALRAKTVFSYSTFIWVSMMMRLE